MSAAVQVSGIALENSRLEAGLRAQLLAVQEARARLLHDGAQQRLLALGLRLGTIEATADDAAVAAAVQSAREELHVALDELRSLAHGLYPAIQRQAGLGPAIESVTERLPW